jgi:hypothetical protein
MLRFRFRMVRSFPPQFLNVDPPLGVLLVACHDNVLYVETLLRQQLFLYLANTTRNDW